jgi:hypothetical protein
MLKLDFHFSLTRRVRFLPVAVLLMAIAAHGVQSVPPSASADAQRYINDIKALTDPSMEGRGDGTEGLTRAEHLLEQRYKSLGLAPAGTHGYLQPFTVITGAQLKGQNEMRVQSAGAKAGLKPNQDFVPFSFSSSGSVSGPVVFVGYGASAPEFGYDDYENIDVKDKVVVILRREPAAFAAKSGNHGETRHAQFVTKAINAKNHGARAVVLVNGKMEAAEEDLLLRFGSASGPEDTGILMVQMKNAIAGQWLREALKSLADVQEQIDKEGKPVSFQLPASLQVSVSVNIEHTKATVSNVLAWLPGETDEYVIIGAHYDHLGRGDAHSLAPALLGQLHPGADDNASGTAGVLELARRFAPMKGKLRRGILFASFAGEELGLLGSAEWVKSPTRPLGKAVAMLNMDMIGRIKDDKVYIGGVGTGSNFKNLLQEAQSRYPFNIEYSASGYSSSDHTSFVIGRVPSLFFFSGLHSDYHKPSDTWEKINPQSAVRLLDLVQSVGEQLASSADRPAFVQVVEDQQAAHGGSGGGYGPYFGSVPDFGQVETGVKFADIRPGSPAAKAGLRGGDIMIQFGDNTIKNLYDFTDALQRRKVGDVVEVTVLRDGKPMTVSVKLEQRK